MFTVSLAETVGAPPDPFYLGTARWRLPIYGACTSRSSRRSQGAGPGTAAADARRHGLLHSACRHAVIDAGRSCELLVPLSALWHYRHCRTGLARWRSSGAGGAPVKHVKRPPSSSGPTPPPSSSEPTSHIQPAAFTLAEALCFLLALPSLSASRRSRAQRGRRRG
jgi:hypothetical protein